MECHKASSNHEQIYLENSVHKRLKLHGDNRLKKYITTFETYPVSAAILEEVPVQKGMKTKRFTKS